jgi:hypothetical protein
MDRATVHILIRIPACKITCTAPFIGATNSLVHLDLYEFVVSVSSASISLSSCLTITNKPIADLYQYGRRRWCAVTGAYRTGGPGT